MIDADMITLCFGLLDVEYREVESPTSLSEYENIRALGYKWASEHAFTELGLNGCIKINDNLTQNITFTYMPLDIYDDDGESSIHYVVDKLHYELIDTDGRVLLGADFPLGDMIYAAVSAGSQVHNDMKIANIKDTIITWLFELHFSTNILPSKYISRVCPIHVPEADKALTIVTLKRQQMLREGNNIKLSVLKAKYANEYGYKTWATYINSLKRK